MTTASPSAAVPAHVVGDASIWVLGQVAGPEREARVLHAGRDAVYLDLEGACLAVLSARAVQVPCGVRTLLPALPPVPPGSRVLVVDGSVELPGCEVMVTGIVDTTVPVLSAEHVRWGAETLGTVLADRADAVRALLPGAALSALVEADPAAVAPLLGLGPGLTPVGDDVLAGWLATAVAARHPSLARVRREVALAATERTTLLSATLLGCAARGEGVPEFRSLLGGFATGNLDVATQSLALMLRIGETSGAGMVLGALLALQGLGAALAEGAAA